LINNKDLIATIIQKYGSKKRIDGYCNLIGKIFEAAKMQSSITESSIVEWAGLKGKIVFGGGNNNTSSNFSTSTKSSVFINATITCQPKCPICSGYIDSAKSMSYDHIKGKAVGGIGSVNNLQLTHPVCNQNKN
jgi:hypothetical protein